ncbi:MAG: hypothetical protein V8Q54_09400 [Alistipes senegalensis]
MYRDEMNDERAAAERARDAAPRRLRRSAPADEACAAEGTADVREGTKGPGSASSRATGCCGSSSPRWR